MAYIEGTYIRAAMACTECRSFDADKRLAVAYQPREVGRYQSLPYTLLCRYHVSAIKMQNARRAKSRWAWDRDPSRQVTWLDITDDIRAQEQTRYTAEVEAAKQAKAERDDRAAQADREYTRNAKRVARATRKAYGERRFVAAEVIRTDVPGEHGNADTVRYTIVATTDSGTTGEDTKVESLAWVNVSLPTYNTWDGGKFIPSTVKYTEGDSIWLFSPDLIRGYVVQAMALALAEAASLNAGWLK